VTSRLCRRKVWRRGPGSNRRIKVLQTSPLPLGYRALAGQPFCWTYFPTTLANPAGAGRRLERETRFELATLALARRCSTTELLPLKSIPELMYPSAFGSLASRLSYSGIAVVANSSIPGGPNEVKLVTGFGVGVSICGSSMPAPTCGMLSRHWLCAGSGALLFADDLAVAHVEDSGGNCGRFGVMGDH
jgi:hypothetical protein